MPQPSVRMLSGSRPRRLVSALVLSASLAFSGISHAAPAAGRARQAAARVPAATPVPRGEGLDSLDNGRVMAELADRGLDNLLDYYFQTHNVPEDQQKGIRTLKALRELNDPARKMSWSERQKRVEQAAAGINAALPNIKDPVLLMQYQFVLAKYGVERDANTLEYFGSNPITEQRLKSVADTVFKVLGQASKEATAQAAELAAKFGANAPPALAKKWDQMDHLASTALYNQHMFAYYVALATPKGTGKDAFKARAKIADDALTNLKEFDDPTIGVQPEVRNMMGKLNLVKGDYKEAIQIFSTIAEPAKDVQPPPNADQQYMARYFRNVAKLESGDLAGAKAGLAELRAWQKTALKAQEGVEAAADMLQYRILVQEGDRAEKAGNASAKRDADDAAIKLLQDLRTKIPAFQAIIDQQLVERLPANRPVQQLDPLILQGLTAKGIAETNRPPGEVKDTKVMQRALEAARELVARKEGVTPKMKDDATIRVAVLLENLGDAAGAAKGYLAYAQANAKDVTRRDAARDALADAGRLVFNDLRKSANAPGAGEATEQFYRLAIGTFGNRKDLAYLYANRLAVEGKSREALEYYRLVPRDDKHFADAQFYMLAAMADLLDQTKDAEHARLAAEVVTQAEAARKAAAGAADAVGRNRWATATLIEAKALNNDLKKPEETLKLLTGFEDAVKGLKDQKRMETDALLTRVNAQVTLNQLDQATASLVSLLNATGGSQGIALASELVERLRKNYDKAEAANDKAAMRDVARNRAALSGFLVDWVQKNPKPDIKKYLYQYTVLDAGTHRLAGTLAEDPAVRKQALEKALASYQQLNSAEGRRMFAASLTDEQRKAGIDGTEPDVNVTLGIALTQYELGDYKSSAATLGELLGGGKLGGAEAVNAEGKLVQNDVYWDATYKLYRSNVAMAAADKKDPKEDKEIEPTRKGLMNLLVRGGIPPKWQERFEGLRQELVPHFNPDTAIAPTTNPAQPTQPVSKR